MVGFVIGKGGHNIRDIAIKTSTYIKTANTDGQTYFVINGEIENQYSAKLEIKTCVLYRSLKSQSLEIRLQQVDASTEERIRVQPADFSVPHITKNLFRLVSVNPRPEEDVNKDADYTFLSVELSKILHKNKERAFLSKIWCHLGRVFITNFNQEEEPTDILTVVDLNTRLLPTRMGNNHPTADSHVKKLNTKFFEGIKNEGIDERLSKWESRPKKYPNFRRHEFNYYTPSCRELRIKIFFKIITDKENPSIVLFKNTKYYEEVGNVLRSSETPPYFYVCDSNKRSAVIDILQPHSPMDVRLIVEGNLPHERYDSELKREADILYDYVQSNIEIKSDGTAELPRDKAPENFDLHLSRVCHRRAYSFVTENEETFTVKLSHEDFNSFLSGRRQFKNMVDIHLTYHEWEEKLEGDTWDPKEIVNKFPVFMRCARSLASTLFVDATIPPEIIARGPAAQEAYENALKSGFTKDSRVLVMLIGQARAGKTSLLRSLKDEMFDPHEDSTSGVKMERSLSMLDGTTWVENVEQDVNRVEGRAVAKQLKAKYETFSDSEVPEQIVATPQEFKDVFPQSQYNLEGREDHSDISVLYEKQQTENTPSKGSPKLPIVVPNQLEPTESQPIPETVTRETTELLQNPEDEEKYGQRIFSTIIDFAGQPVYQATHPVFLSQKGIYILVHNLENDAHAQAISKVKHGDSVREVKDSSPMTNMDHLEFWLSAVACFAGTMEKGEDYRAEINEKLAASHSKDNNNPIIPRVILVCTHADRFPVKESKQKARQILRHLKRKDYPLGDHVVRIIFTVDNTISGSGNEEKNIKELKRKIYEEASGLPHTKRNIPIRWLRYEKKLFSLVQNEGKKYISLEDAKCVANSCQISEEDELRTLLNYLHDLKVIIYFKEINADIVIIDTQWLLDMFVKVITVQPFEDWQEAYENSWRNLEERGVLDRDLVKHVWMGLVDSQSTIDYLLLIMEQFSLICRWRQPQKQDIFLVPAMLVNSDAKSVHELQRKFKWSPLVIRFTSAHLPLGIFPRLLVAIVEVCNTKWPNSRQPSFFNNFCRFFDVGEDGDLDVSFTSDTKTITVGIITETSDPRTEPIISLSQIFFESIKKILIEMRLKFPWMKAMKYEFGIRCPICLRSSESKLCYRHNIKGCLRDTCLHFVLEEELKLGKPRCYEDTTNPTTSIPEEFYYHWFPKRSQQQSVICDDVLPAEHLTDDDSKSPELAIESLESAFKALVDTAPSETKGMNIPQIEKALLSFTDDEAAEKVSSILELDRISLTDPTSNKREPCLRFCKMMKQCHRAGIVKALRNKLPSGMTGPVHFDGNTLVKNMDYKTKFTLSRGLTAKDEWKVFAEKAGVTKTDIDFYDKREKNPILTILDEHCGDMTIEKLYNFIVESGADAVADNYL